MEGEGEGEYGCEYCRNDGELSNLNICPVCDAEWLEEE